MDYTAETIIDEIKKNGNFVICDSIKPIIRKELVTDYQLYIEKRSDNKWIVRLDKPIRFMDIIIEHLEHKKEVRGDFPLGIRNELKKNGLFVYGDNNEWVICRDINEKLKQKRKTMSYHIVII